MPEKFGVRLARLRKQAGFQQGEFAKLIGVRQSFISMLEHDARSGDKIQGGTLLQMARRLGVTVEYLLTGRHRSVSQQHDATETDVTDSEVEPADTALVGTV